MVGFFYLNFKMRKYLITFIIVFIYGLICFCIGFYVDRKNNHYKGMEEGFDICITELDTIIKRQSEKEKQVSKVCLIKKDTVTYYLSKKLLKK